MADTTDASGKERTAELKKRLDALAGAFKNLGEGKAGTLGADLGPALGARVWGPTLEPLPAVVAELAKLGIAVTDDLLASVGGFRKSAEQAAAAAHEQARRLTWATWVLAVSTVVLAASTVALVYVTAGGG